MVCRTRKTKKRKSNRLDIVRRAKLLGVTPGHLYRVISGERQSLPLIVRLSKLLEVESAQQTIRPKADNRQKQR
jgi:hypothetical protein